MWFWIITGCYMDISNVLMAEAFLSDTLSYPWVSVWSFLGCVKVQSLTLFRISANTIVGVTTLLQCMEYVPDFARIYATLIQDLLHSRL